MPKCNRLRSVCSFFFSEFSWLVYVFYLHYFVDLLNHSQEIYPPKLSEFAYVTDGACTENEILVEELLMLKVTLPNSSVLTKYTQGKVLSAVCHRFFFSLSTFH